VVEVAEFALGDGVALLGRSTVPAHRLVEIDLASHPFHKKRRD